MTIKNPLGFSENAQLTITITNEWNEDVTLRTMNSIVVMAMFASQYCKHNGMPQHQEDYEALTKIIEDKLIELNYYQY